MERHKTVQSCTKTVQRIDVCLKQKYTMCIAVFNVDCKIKKKLSELSVTVIH